MVSTAVAHTPGVPVSGFDPFEHHVVTGGEYLRLGRVKDAQRAFLSALELKPGDAKALALLGLSYFRGGLFAEARPIYEDLVARSPDDASYHLNLGLVHLKLGEADKAIKQLELSRALDPSQGRAVSYLGLAYARAGLFPEAYQAFLHAGQGDLAREVEQHLTPEEKQKIDAQLRRAQPPAAESVSQRFVALGSPPAPASGPAHKRASAPTEPPPRGPAAVAAVAATMPQAAPPPPPRPASQRPSTSPPVRAATDPEVEIEVGPSASQEFIAVKDDGAVLTPMASQTAISRAVAQAAPSSGNAGAGTRVATGSRPPQPLSEFATSRLVRPEDGDFPFEISATGVLIVRVDGKMLSRTEGVDVTGGHLAYEPATRRSRGAQTAEPFDTGGRPMFVVSGKGHLVASPVGGHFTAVQLDDDIFYLREDVVYAFEPGVRWENGHVPGSRARIPMVQFRGAGAVAFRTPRPLLAIKLAPERVLYIDANALAGWIGRVVPRAVAPQGTSRLSELFVECTGEGVVLVQEEQGPNLANPTAPVERRRRSPTSSAGEPPAADESS